MSKCEDCFYWKPFKNLKAHGDCLAPLPFWASEEYRPWRLQGEGCNMFSEVDIFAENEELKDKIYNLKTAVEMLKDAVDFEG